MQHFERKKVEVNIQLGNGRPRTLEAITYVWKHDFGLDGPWSINEFIKRPCFNQCFEAEAGDKEWTTEEEELVKKMKMTYILAGEALGHAVSEEDFEEVTMLLKHGNDVNGACRPYGTPLQTAVVGGNEEMVRMLLERGATVNSKGGQYQTSLLAAVMCGHEEIVSLLLRHGVDVLADGGRHIGALYQAISHSDTSIVYLLLEQGAWLTKGYTELLDLAAERGNSEIKEMLMEYDVRQLYLALPAYHGSLARRNRQTLQGQEVALLSRAILQAVVGQVLILKGSHGTWQGRKGILVLKAALAAGAPDGVVDQVGTHLGTISSLVGFFRVAVMEMLQPGSSNSKDLESALDKVVVVEDLGSDDDEHSDNDATSLIGDATSPARAKTEVSELKSLIRESEC